MEVDRSDVRVPLTEALTEEIAAYTGLLLTGWRDLGGSWSTNLAAVQVDRPERLVFRVHQRFVTRERLLAEQHTRCSLAASGMPTVGVLPIFRGSTIARLVGGNLVEAEPLIASDANMDTPDKLLAGFAVLGALHDSLRAASLPAAAYSVIHANHLDGDVAGERTRAGVARIGSWGLPALTRFAEQIDAHVTEVRDQEIRFLAGQHRQVVHGDFWDNNVLFSGGNVTAVLDFGFMAERLRIDDLALPIWFHLLGSRMPAGSAMEFVASLLDAYDRGSSQPLTPDERLSLPLVIARQPAWLVGRWVAFDEDEARARHHAVRAADDFSTAADVLANLQQWQRALS